MDLQAAVLLLIILDPVGNVPIFAAVLRGMSPAQARLVVLRESLLALAILLAVLWAGGPVLSWLGLSQPALGLAGGIVLFLIALRMIFPTKGGVFGEGDLEPGPAPIAVPLAVPLIAGPSAVATLMLFSAKDPAGTVGLSVALLAAWGASTACLLATPTLGRWLGERVLEAAQRLLGMLLAAVSVQQFLDGLRAALAAP
jgi:MarC family membrane protein